MNITNCPTCGYPVDRIDDEKLLPLVKGALESFQSGATGWYRKSGWEVWEEAELGYAQDVPPLGRVTVVANTRNYRGYDETDEGGEDYYVVLEIDVNGEKKYFRQDFHFSSYGDNSVDGPLRLAVGRTKTVTIFE
jgi:hypothetical protein